MAPNAGYLATIKVGGTPTTFTDEATTDVGGAHTTYQVTDGTKRVWDTGTAPTVKKNGSVVSAALYTVDYLFGKVTFLSALLGTDVVTITGKYLPLLTVTTAKECSYQLANDLLDNTTFSAAQASVGEKTRIYGMQDASGSLGAFDDGLTDFDAGAGTVTLSGMLEGRSAVLVEYDVGQGEKLRAWVLFDNNALKTPVAALVETTISWKSATIPGIAGFAFGT